MPINTLAISSAIGARIGIDVFKKVVIASVNVSVTAVITVVSSCLEEGIIIF